MKTGFVGVGKMAEAIIAALLRSGVVAKPSSIIAFDIDKRRLGWMRRRHGIHAAGSNAEVVASADVVVLAVKPQDMDAVLAEIAQAAARNSPLFISIAAGIRLAWLQRCLGSQAKIVRTMPNLPALVGQGMTAFCPGRNLAHGDKRKVERILSSFGQVIRLPERQFDAVTALSGSGPAFFSCLLECMIAAGTDAGLGRAAAVRLALQTMRGTADLLAERKIEPSELIERVASRGGTTEAGLRVLQNSDIARVLKETLHAAAARSKALSSLR